MIDTRTLYQALLSAKIFCENVRRSSRLWDRKLDNLEPMLEEALLLLNDQPNE